MNRHATIQEELKSISSLVAGIERSNVFTVPEGYFSQVPATVLACIRETDGSLQLPQSADQNVPAGYFNQLADQILARVKAEEEEELSPLLQQLRQLNPYTVPDRYFDQLPGDVLVQATADQVQGLPEGLHLVTPYTVPNGYFEQLPERILHLAKEATPGKLVQLSFGKRLLRYAAAVAVGIGLAYGGYRVATNQPADLQTAALDPGIEKGMHMDEQKFNETLNSLSEEDVLKYLEANGSEVDVATLATKLADNTLPTEEDFMVDDQAMDKFLESINSTN